MALFWTSNQQIQIWFKSRRKFGILMWSCWALLNSESAFFHPLSSSNSDRQKFLDRFLANFSSAIVLIRIEKSYAENFSHAKYGTALNHLKMARIQFDNESKIYRQPNHVIKPVLNEIKPIWPKKIREKSKEFFVSVIVCRVMLMLSTNENANFFRIKNDASCS